MIRKTTILMLAGLISLGGLDAVAAATGFSRYEGILTRNPFGLKSRAEIERDRPVVRTAVTPVAPPPSFAGKVRLSMMTQTENGVLVGFVFTDGKKSTSYLLTVGERDGGFEVKSANVEEESAKIAYNGDVQPFTMGQTVSAAERGAAGVGASTAAAAPKPGSRVSRSRRRGATSGAAKSASYHEMLKARNEAARKKREAEAANRREETERLTGEALRKHLQEYNMKLIRSGGAMGPPLPIQLTPEQDNRLVEEGHLPPPGAPAALGAP